MNAGSVSGSSSLSSTVDAYGFERPDDFDYATYEEFMSDYMAILARRAMKWSTVVEGTVVNGGKDPLRKSSKIKRYIRKGIPSEHRAEVWMRMSGAQEKMMANQGLYKRLLEQEAEPVLVELIEKDVPRTFPENIYFQDTPSDPNAKRRPLFNVLLALAHKNPAVGYCQGMNFIAGILLLIVKDEEKTFWLMDVITTDLFPGYYTPDMNGCRVDQEVLGELVKLKIPKMAALFEREGVTWTLISAKWFICLMGDVLPVETVLRIWDCLFYEGTKILFRVAITLLKRNEEKILESKNFPEIISACKVLTNQPMVVHCHEFMQSIFKEPGSFPRSLIQKLRIQAQQSIT